MQTSSPTPRELAAMEKRLTKLRWYFHYQSEGHSNAGAARLAGLSVTTAWRYDRAVQRHGGGALLFKHPKGRQSLVDFYRIPEATLRDIAASAVRLRSAKAALKAFARTVDCPAALSARILDGRPPGSLLKAVTPERLKAEAWRTPFGEVFASITEVDQ